MSSGSPSPVSPPPAGKAAATAEETTPPPQKKWRTKAVRDALRVEIESRLGAQVAAPKISVAKEEQERLLPHDEDGNLLPVFCPIETFRIFGAGVYSYVCWMQFMEKVFLVAFAFSLPNMIHNVAGGELSPEETTWMTVHTLGNVNHVNASYGAVELIVATVFILALWRGMAIIDRAAEEVEADGSCADLAESSSSSCRSSPGRGRSSGEGRGRGGEAVGATVRSSDKSPRHRRHTHEGSVGGGRRELRNSKGRASQDVPISPAEWAS